MFKYIKVLLISKRIFRNWLSLNIKYFLARLGILKGEILIGIIGDCIITFSPKAYVRFLGRAFRGLIRDVKCINGKVYVHDIIHPGINYTSTLEIPNNNTDKYFTLISSLTYKPEIWGWRYDEKANCWTKDNLKFKHINYPIIEVFGYKEYEKLNVRDRVVVDVGAYVGDSAIYFALKGASKVIAIEPHPEAYQEMLENIRLNGMEGKIIPINAGLASKPGCIGISGNVYSTKSTYHRLSNKSTNCVEAITLNSIIEKFSIVSSIAVLKMDCEGCEYDIILNDYEHIKLFKEIIFEYHARKTGIPVTKLLKKLNKDFRCIRIMGNDNLGVIHCVRNY